MGLDGSVVGLQFLNCRCDRFAILALHHDLPGWMFRLLLIASRVLDLSVSSASLISIWARSRAGHAMVAPQRHHHPFSKWTIKTFVMHFYRDIPACNQVVEVQAIPGPRMLHQCRSAPHVDKFRHETWPERASRASVNRKIMLGILKGYSKTEKRWLMSHSGQAE